MPSSVFEDSKINKNSFGYKLGALVREGIEIGPLYFDNPLECIRVTSNMGLKILEILQYSKI